MNHNDDYIEFLDWMGSYAKFRIHKKALPDGYDFKEIVVSHEGDWISSGAMFCYPEYQHYEDVQKALGKGLTFIGKQYQSNTRRSIFRYALLPCCDDYLLSVPATGEELCFEIYGASQFGTMTLLFKGEL